MVLIGILFHGQCVMISKALEDRILQELHSIDIGTVKMKTQQKTLAIERIKTLT